MSVKIPETVGMTVSQLNSYIRGSLLAEDMLQSTFVRGEIAGFKTSGEHAYFSVKDENSSIDCTYFHYKRRHLPKNGELVILLGGVDFYAKAGKINFKVERIEPIGKGVLQAQFEELKAKFTALGVFSAEKKKPIPKYCENVGVITSKTGAVIRDIVTTARKNNTALNLTLHNVRVQGVDAVNDILRALIVADGMGYDAIIIARGGGSIEDLMPFNSEILVNAVFNVKTPIISAVGHETDFTLCDFVADIRVATPTAAAELVAYNQVQLKNQILTTVKILKNQAVARFDYAYEKLKILTNNLVHNTKDILKSKEFRTRELFLALDANSPARIFEKGYFKVVKNNLEQANLKEIKKGDIIEIVGDNERIGAEVKNGF